MYVTDPVQAICHWIINQVLCEEILVLRICGLEIANDHISSFPVTYLQKFEFIFDVFLFTVPFV